MKFSMNSNALRKKCSVQEIVEIAKAAGVQGMEWGLGPIDGALEEAKTMLKATQDAGLEVVSFINGGLLWKTDEIRRWSEAVKAGGGSVLRVAPPWFAYNYDESVHQADDFMTLVNWSREGLAKLMELGKEYDIRYVLETHGASCFAAPQMVPWILGEFDPKYCGVIYDVANTYIEGFLRPRAAVEIMKDYIAYMHVKNVAFVESVNAEGRTVFKNQRRTLDKGMVDYVEVMFALKLHKWDGWFSFEEFVTPEPSQTAAEISAGIEHLKWAREQAKDAIEEPYLPFNH